MFFHYNLFFTLPAAGTLLILLITSCSTSEPASVSDEHLSGVPVGQDLSSDQVAEARSHFIRGLTAKELDDLESAERHLTRAQSILHQSSGVNYALAELYLKMEDFVNAIYYGNRAVDLEPDNKWFRMLLINSYRATGDLGQMMAQFDIILDQNPSDVEVLFQKARILSGIGDYEASNETLQKILNITGPDRSVYYQRISNFSRLEDTEAVINELNRVLEMDPGNISTLMMLSQYYLEINMEAEARNSLESVLKRNPRHPEALVNLADLHINMGNWEEAGGMLNSLVSDTLVSSSDKIEIVQFVINRFHHDSENESLQNTTEALIDTLLHTEPDNGMAHAMAAEYFLILNNGQQALSHLQQTTQLMPENDAAWRQLIQTYYVEGKYEKAIETGKLAEEHVPEDAFIHFFIGGSYFLLDEPGQAAQWLNSASELPSRSRFRSIIFGTLGDTYASMDQWENADEAYEQSISYDPDNDVALNNYAYYLSERGERLEQAKEMVTRALEINPDNAAFLDTLGWVYYQMGDYDNAYHYIRASIDTGDASAEVMEHMGDVYDKLGEPDQALYWWQKALEKDDSRIYLEERLHIN